IVKLLLDNGADVNFINSYHKESALIIAIKENNIEIVKLLVKYNIKMNYFDDINQNPLICAYCTKNFKIIKILLKYGSNPNIIHKSKNYFLGVCLNTKNLDLFKLLFSKGLKID